MAGVEVVDLGGGARAIRGYRVWRLDLLRTLRFPDPDERKFPSLFFFPVFRGVVYMVGSWSFEEFKEYWCAECGGACSCPFEPRGEQLAGHRPGWYAYRDLEGAIFEFSCQLGQSQKDPSHAGWVVGTCLLAGKVVLAQRGYRATHAVLESLIGPDEESIYLLKPVHALTLPDLYFLAQHPPLVAMRWRYTADIPVWVIPNFEEMFRHYLRQSHRYLGI